MATVSAKADLGERGHYDSARIHQADFLPVFKLRLPFPVAMVGHDPKPASSSSLSFSNWLAGLQKAWPDFLIAGSFLLVWFAPGALGRLSGWLPGVELVGIFVFLMFFEFFFVVAFGPVAFLAYSQGLKKGQLVGLGVILLIMAPFLVTLCRAASGIWPVIEVIILGYNKWHSGRQGSDQTLGNFHIVFRWATMASLYIAVMFLVYIVPIPVLGVEAWMVRESGIPISGDMANEPHRFLAAGTIYFACLGLYEIIFERMAPGKR